eukprot:143208-Rhodomonas_salina.5
MPGTAIAHGRICLRAHSTMFGTDVPYGATRNAAKDGMGVGWYQAYFPTGYRPMAPMRYVVLRKGVVLPGEEERKRRKLKRVKLG